MRAVKKKAIEPEERGKKYRGFLKKGGETSGGNRGKNSRKGNKPQSLGEYGSYWDFVGRIPTFK